jgi:DNA-binding transcriptional MerR regulator
VRLYEKIGFLQPAERSDNRYRLFTSEHADQMVLARRALDGDFVGREMRESVKKLVMTAASGDMQGALTEAHRHLELASVELNQAIGTVEEVEKWVNQSFLKEPAESLNTSRTARRLNVTIDSLRTWERNDLIRVPRNPVNGYRLYGVDEIIRLRIIRMLRTAGYSLMAIYRMLKKLDGGQTRGLAKILDTPGDSEDFFCAADRWITSLKLHEEKAKDLIALVETRMRKQLHGNQ